MAGSAATTGSATTGSATTGSATTGSDTTCSGTTGSGTTNVGFASAASTVGTVAAWAAGRGGTDGGRGGSAFARGGGGIDRPSSLSSEGIRFEACAAAARKPSFVVVGSPTGTMSRRNGASAAASISAAQRSCGTSDVRAALVSVTSRATSSAGSLAAGSGSRPASRMARMSLPSVADAEMSVTQLVRSPSMRPWSASRSFAAMARESSSRATPSAWVTTARRSRKLMSSAAWSAAAARSSQSA